MSERIARQTRRDHCRGCGTRTLHPFAGWVTADGRENTIRPRAYYRSCSQCGLLVMVLDDVTDAEGLARAVLDKHLRALGGAATATSQPVGPPPLDWDTALNHLLEECWTLYERHWNPSYGDGRVTFRGYATQKMKNMLYAWIRDESGEASDRAKGRVHPKAHAPSVSVSLDQLLAAHEETGNATRGGNGGDSRTVGRGGDDPGAVETPYLGRARDLADDRSPDLAWALEAARRR